MLTLTPHHVSSRDMSSCHSFSASLSLSCSESGRNPGLKPGSFLQIVGLLQCEHENRSAEQ